MTYQLRRPPTRDGQGPLTVYRAISTVGQPLLQQPMGWVRLQPAFQGLAVDSTPLAAAALAAASVPNVEKVWTEMAYEAGRVAVAPNLPSRLGSLFCFADPLEALSFTEVAGEAKHVWEAEVQAGIPWALVDMSQFEVVNPSTQDASGYQTAWDQAFRRASSYWAPDADVADVKVAEILIAGPAMLIRRLELLPLLRELGLVEQAP